MFHPSAASLEKSLCRLLALALPVLAACSSSGGPSSTNTTGGSGAMGGSSSVCATGQVQCATGCADPSSDEANCGSCGTTCSAGASCTSGHCQCQTTLSDCAGSCVDTQSSASDCGACGKACAVPSVCSRGQCQSSCAQGLVQCGTDCVDPATSIPHCGSCDHACASGQTCENSVCVCTNTQERLCGGRCVDARSDPNNCGDCGVSCGAKACNGGVCATGTGGSGTGGAATGGTGASGGTGGTGGTTGGTGGTTGGTGGTTGGTGGGSTGGTAGTGGTTGCGVPTTFKWSSTGPLIGPASGLTAIKDPTVVYFNNRWNIYASTTDQNGNYNSTYLGFTDWNSAGSATQTPLQGGVAPQVFYFAPKNLWYRVYEWPDVYATSTDPTNPKSWSGGKTFYSGEPTIVTQNKGTGGWIDFWVICDDTNCYLFFSDDNGHLYRAKTPVGNFPNGFDTPVIVLSDSLPGRLFEACNVYSMKGTGKYLLLIEAYDSGSGGRRYFRSWTAPALDGAWTPLQAEYATPFASAANVTFSGTAWTKDISHGEMLRSGYDQKLEIDTCNLRYLYQGRDPSSSGNYNTLPWRLGLLTKTN